MEGDAITMTLSNVGFVSSLQSQASTLKNGLLGYWNFDGGDGDNEADLQGSIGMLIQYTDGDAATSVAGPGSHYARYFTTNGAPALRVNTTSGGVFPLTINFWAKIDDNGDTGGLPFSFGEASTWGPPWYTYSYGGTFYTNITDNDSTTSAQNNGATDYKDSTWHMFTLQVDDSKYYTIYVDGVLQSWTETQTNPLTGTAVETFDHIAFGHSFYFDDFNTSDGYTGAISLAGLWSRALTGSEITSLYNSGNGKDFSEL